MSSNDDYQKSNDDLIKNLEQSQEKSKMTHDLIVKWGLFIALTWLEFGIGFNWLAQSAIKDQTKKYFNIQNDNFKYRILGENFYCALFVSNFFGTILAKKSFRLNVLIACFLVTSGTILKWLAADNYEMAIVGILLTGLCQGFVYPAPAALAMTFFPKKQQSYVIAIPTFFTMVGCAFGLWLPQYLLPDKTSSDEVLKKNMNIICIVGIICTVPSIIFVIPSQFSNLIPLTETSNTVSEQLIVEKAKTDIQNESMSSEFEFERQALLKTHGSDELGWCDSYLVQQNNKNCFFTFIAGALLLSVWWNFQTSSANTLDNFGMQDNSAIICLMYIIVGSIASIPQINTFDERKYVGIKINLLFACICMAILIILNYYQNDPETNKHIYKNTIILVVLIIVFVASGVIFPTLLGLYLNFCVDISFPASESLTTGNLIAFSVLFAFMVEEIVSAVEKYQFVAYLMQIVGVSVISFYGMKDTNTVSKYDGYFCKKCMVKRKIFRNKKQLNNE